MLLILNIAVVFLQKQIVTVIRNPVLVNPSPQIPIHRQIMKLIPFNRNHQRQVPILFPICKKRFAYKLTVSVWIHIEKISDMRPADKKITIVFRNGNRFSHVRLHVFWQKICRFAFCDLTFFSDSIMQGQFKIKTGNLAEYCLNVSEYFIMKHDYFFFLCQFFLNFFACYLFKKSAGHFGRGGWIELITGRL